MIKSYYLETYEISIIEGIRANDRSRASFERKLYDSYKYLVDEGCRKFHITQEDSFTAYSDAVLSVICNIMADRFDGRSSLKTYLYQVFSNKCIDLVRKNTTNKQQVNHSVTSPELLVQLPDAARTVIERLVDQQKMDVIQKQMAILGQKCKEILLLFEDGFSDREISEKLEYSTAAVAKITRLRCLEKLREKVLEFFN